MNLTALTIRVQQSRLLAESEKMYWMQHLPRMSEAQIQKLESVLAAGENLHWTASIPNYEAAQKLIPQSA